MPVLPAVAPGPVSFTDPASGKFVCLPLSVLSFDNGAIKGSGALYNAYKPAADATLAHLVAIGYLKPGPPPVLKPALKVQAVTPGSPGNGIQVEFFDYDYATPANPTFKVRATQMIVYAGLTTATVQSVLGSAAGPGPVFVPGAAPAAGLLPKAGDYPLTVTAPATTAAVTIPKEPGPGDAFKLEARADGPDGALTTVKISDVDPVTKKFTLTARWEKITPARIATSAVDAAFAYLIDIEPPDGGAVAPPAAGLVSLSGGAEPATAKKASAIAAG